MVFQRGGRRQKGEKAKSPGRSARRGEGDVERRDFWPQGPEKGDAKGPIIEKQPKRKGLDKKGKGLVGQIGVSWKEGGRERGPTGSGETEIIRRKTMANNTKIHNRE